MNNHLMKRSMLTIAVLTALNSPNLMAVEAEESTDEKSSSMETITVTSQKRVERLIDVPLSVTSVDQKELAQRGIKQLQDLGDTAPNLNISESIDFRSSVSIRGVGADSRNIGFDSRVGIYIDGVYLGQSPSINQGLVDLERVEVLRGPQGTLFGKNTIAGAINLISQKPTDQFEGSITANVGNFDAQDYHLKLNIPMGESTAAKVFVNRAVGGAYTKNNMTGQDLGGRDATSGRINLVSNLTDALELNFSADYLTHDILAVNGMALTDVLGYDPATGPASMMLNATNRQDLSVGFTEATKDNYATFSNRDTTEKKDVWGSSITFDYTTDSDYTFKSITAYRSTEMDIDLSSDVSPLDMLHTPYQDTYKQTSQEFQWISPDLNNLRYLVGVYLFDLDSTTDRKAIAGRDMDIYTLLLPIPSTGIDYSMPAVESAGSVDTQSYAVFTNGSYDFNDQWQLGFGLRYSAETKDVDWAIKGTNSGLFRMATAHIVDDRKDDFLAPSLNLNYAVTEDSQAYARVSTGFKSGGYNLDFVTNDVIDAGIEFDKETVLSYELGYKAQLLDNHLRLSSALFRAEYDDYQVNQYVDLGGGRTAISITNAAAVISQGLELEMDYQVTDDFQITGSLGLLDATFDSFPGGGTAGSDASGNKLPNAPEVTAALGVQYYQSLSSLNSTLMYRLDYNYTAEQYFLVNNDENYQIPGTGEVVDFDKADSYSTLNARITLMSDMDNWQVSLWGQNLTDSNHMVESYREFFGGINAIYAKPRSFGVEATYNF
ncbi:TonB-dependent receptor [Shewanella gaetbuli]|uniref:TonB-dependent receptor n=1 Tax=Shewanella gaetbuli TaxID=220752 RepID=A0A9X2CGH8_9GAMM|nr:TonB-dependent receptor [Shewanella gaetbuli]MCL1142398.1 TonB-dependent receptor [Shewanella gaetbuli]